MERGLLSMFSDDELYYLNYPDDIPPWVKPFENIPDQQLNAAYTEDYMDHCSELNYRSEPSMQKLTGIICTIGRSSRNPRVLMKMFEAGMNIARLNFSHGDHEFHKENLDNIHKAVRMYSKKIGSLYPVGIALDTRGPEMRTGTLKGGTNKSVDLRDGQRFVISTNPVLMNCGNSDRVFVNDPFITKMVRPGDVLDIDGGIIQAVVEDITPMEIFTRIVIGGTLGSNKNINLPAVPIEMPAISKQDRKDLLFAAENNIDFILGSYIRDARTIHEMRQIIGEKGKGCMIIAKIECIMSLENIDEIIAAADGIMIARADLSMDLPSDKVFLVQKMIFAKCNMVGRPCICASQMLESMVQHPRPTRAEVADVANAVLDGCDCTVLSNETSKGKYPVQSVEMMSNIIKEAESATWQKQLFTEMCNLVKPPIEPWHGVAIAAVNAALKSCASAIIVVSTTGRTARLIARYRPRCPIITVTRHSKVVRQNTIFRGILSLHYVGSTSHDWLQDMDRRIKFAVLFGKKQGFIHHRDPLILVTGWRHGTGHTNTLRIVYASASGTDAV